MNKMRTLRFIEMGLIALLVFVNIVACSDDNENVEDIEMADEIPMYLDAGTKILFNGSTSNNHASYGFGWFIARSITECQWIPSYSDPDNYIRPEFSTATYTYKTIGENQAVLTSTNKQITSAGRRTWTTTITMTFEKHNSGIYTSIEKYLNNGTSQTVEGTFEFH